MSNAQIGASRPKVSLCAIIMSAVTPGNQRRLEEQVAQRMALAAGQHLAGFGARIGDVLFELGHRLGVDQRALCNAGLQARADHQRFNEREGKPGSTWAVASHLGGNDGAYGLGRVAHRHAAEIRSLMIGNWCAGRDLNPYAPFREAAGFKPDVSADSTTRARRCR